MQLPRARSDADPFQWWFNNRFVLHPASETRP
jgi:hypothetical protein